MSVARQITEKTDHNFVYTKHLFEQPGKILFLIQIKIKKTLELCYILNPVFCWEWSTFYTVPEAARRLEGL